MAEKFPTPQERAMAWLLEATEIGGMSKPEAALWAVVTADGVNRTGCKHFDLHNPGQKEMGLEH